MEKEIIVTKEYKNIKCFVKRIEKELEKAGLDDWLERYVSEEIESQTIKEKLLKGDYDYQHNEGNKEYTIAIDIRSNDFIYIYTRFTTI